VRLSLLGKVFLKVPRPGGEPAIVPLTFLVKV